MSVFGPGMTTVQKVKASALLAAIIGILAFTAFGFVYDQFLHPMPAVTVSNTHGISCDPHTGDCDLPSSDAPDGDSRGWDY